MTRDIPFDEEVAERDDAEREDEGDPEFVVDTEAMRRRWAEDFDRRVAEDKRRRT